MNNVISRYGKHFSLIITYSDPFLQGTTDILTEKESAVILDATLGDATKVVLLSLCVLSNKN